MPQTNIIGKQMLNALELFQYSYRFRDEIFMLALDESSSIDEIVTDLRILETSHIQVVLFCFKPKNLKESVETWNEYGLSLDFIDNTNPIENIQSCLKKERTPVLEYFNHTNRIKFEESAIDNGLSLNASKVLFLGKEEGLFLNGKYLSHPSTKQVETIIQAVDAEVNHPKECLSLYLQKIKQQKIDIVLIQNKSGNLFQEIFTHRGQGTLITNDYINEIRVADKKDVVDIYLLVKQYMSDGMILTISEDDIRDRIDDYYVCIINGAVVATAMLKNYGEDAELAKFCTLPRFQGKGRARDLALAMIDQARKQNKRNVFALSISPQIWSFFKNLGFEDVEREKLPIEWKEQYDFSRPSKALKQKLK